MPPTTPHFGYSRVAASFNKLWAGRPKDIDWVNGLLGTGIITLSRLEELHAGNPIPAEEWVKVEKSLTAVIGRLASGG